MSAIGRVNKGVETAQREYYNEIAEEYDLHYANSYALQYRYALYDLCLRDRKLQGKRALDAMCGGGEGTGYLLRRGAIVTGIDISEKCCAIYRERFPECDVVCGSFLDPILAEASFDLVLTDSLHHLQPYLAEGIDQVYRVLKPGGYLCCWEPSSRSLIDLVRKAWYRLDRRYFQSNEKSVDVERIFGPQETRFERPRTMYGGHIAYIFVNLSMALRIPNWIVNTYAPLMLSVERLTSRIQPRFLSCWVLCLTRKRNGRRAA
jgi:SAM-dependent methyltransferase